MRPTPIPFSVEWEDAIATFEFSKDPTVWKDLTRAWEMAKASGDARDLGRYWFDRVKPLVKPPVTERDEIHDIVDYNS